MRDHEMQITPILENILSRRILGVLRRNIPLAIYFHPLKPFKRWLDALTHRGWEVPYSRSLRLRLFGVIISNTESLVLKINFTRSHWDPNWVPTTTMRLNAPALVIYPLRSRRYRPFGSQRSPAISLSVKTLCNYTQFDHEAKPRVYLNGLIFANTDNSNTSTHQDDDHNTTIRV